MLKNSQQLISELRYDVKDFKDTFQEKQFVIDINLKRRQLTSYQRLELGLELEKIECEKAKLRQSAEIGKLFDKGNYNNKPLIERDFPPPENLPIINDTNLFRMAVSQIIFWKVNKKL